MGTQAICRQFSKSGTCNRKSCRLRHDQRPQTIREPQMKKSAPKTSPEKGFRAWKSAANLGYTTRLSSNAMDTFFGDARDLIEKEVGVMQDVIQYMAQENGLWFVQELVEMDFTKIQNQTRQILFRKQMIPFLEIISHPKVLSSLVAEHALGTIFNFIYGVNGYRAVNLFDSVCTVLEAADQGDVRVQWLEVSLQVFSRILDINSTAFIQERLRNQAIRLQDIQSSWSDEANNQLLISRRYLDRILQRFDIGAQLPTAPGPKGPGKDRQKVISFIPGQAPPGGRHDNDHADISAIQILPTLEEILSPQPEYLPTRCPPQWHVNGLAGLLDRNFRLLREDMVGQLRDAVYEVIKGPQELSQKKRLRTNVYTQVRIIKFDFNWNSGFMFHVEFPQLPHISRLSPCDRESWWTLSKSLQPGSLVCLSIGEGNVVFCTVVEDPRQKQHGDVSNLKVKEREKQRNTSLWCKAKTASATLSIVNSNQNNTETLLKFYNDPARPFFLVEFPGVLLPSFEPTLRALQGMQKSLSLPFADLLVPPASDEQSAIAVPPPLYTLKRGFRFNLRCLTTDDSNFFVSPNKPIDIEGFQKVSALDEAQAAALIGSLHHCIGLIQGPPGTGKSYTGIALVKALLANREQPSEELGPIICVAYTNHALDQLLEALLDKDITSNIVRIGSQSKSDQLQGLNLRCVARKAAKTKSEKAAQWNLRSELSSCENNFGALSLKKQNSASRVPSHLRLYYPTHHQQLFGMEEQDFKNSRSRDPSKVIRRWLSSGNIGKIRSRPLHELLHVNVLDMCHQEREILHQKWVDEIEQDMRREVFQIISDHNGLKSEWDNVRNEIDLRCLSAADVIGVTTSGLARNLKMFQKLQSKVVLCEEAGEVLEAHLLTALLPSIEHAIFIGDHLQLRPQIQNYDLSRENNNGGSQYSLDISLFERLVEPMGALGSGLPFTTLETQRRMHPSIAHLVRSTLYPRLKDASHVSDYPEVPGMRKRLFWLDHRVPEADDSKAEGNIATTSHWNDHEIDMTIALVNHLISQGSHKSGDIAVLTPYLGQLHRLRQKLAQFVAITIGERDQEQLDRARLGVETEETCSMAKSSMLEALRVATIDNFQGEEAKVVVISLVRSNRQNQCGFLRTSNRINVLLSRAQHGMYIIGNSATSVHVPMWAQVVQILENDDNIGPSLELKCPRHPETPILVSEPNHFLQFSPEGGCNMRCVNRLACGHACEQRCHSELLHKAVYCQRACQRPQKGCTHICPKSCGDPCPKHCSINVFKEGRRLACGHVKEKLPCWQDQDISKFKCREKVKKTVPGCLHEVAEYCSLDATAGSYRCKAQCGSQLRCGHTCKRKCYECGKTREDHEMCQQKCGRNHSTCAHICKSVCHRDEPCPPCEAACDVSCGHSKCTRKCSEPCAPCAEEQCLSFCPHSTCTMPCAAPCDHIPCAQRCENRLNCGHQCPSVCGERCPAAKYCQICASQDIKSHIVDFISYQKYEDIDLEDTPCIFPKCGHFLTIESMDTQMDLTKHYDCDDMGKPIAIKSSSRPFSMGDVKTCALCRGSLRELSRYGRLVRRALLDESTKRFTLYLNREYLPLVEEMAKQALCLQDLKCNKMPAWPATVHISGSSTTLIQKMKTILGNVAAIRWAPVLKLRERVQNYLCEVSPGHQPFIRVLNIVQNARRRQKTAGNFECDSGALQTKGVLLGSSLRLRLDINLLMDFLRLKGQALSQKSGVVITLNLQELRGECRTLIKSAKESIRPLQQAEGYIYLAQLHALERSHCLNPKDNEINLQEGHISLQEAQSILNRFPGQTRGLSTDMDGAEKMLNESTFYAMVTNEERLVVVQAMAREFQGTGHWYYCRNGHPFTIGECGGPMQESVCPECGAPVGGQQHEAAEGVSRADDLEQSVARLSL